MRLTPAKVAKGVLGKKAGRVVFKGKRTHVFSTDDPSICIRVVLCSSEKEALAVCEAYQQMDAWELGPPVFEVSTRGNWAVVRHEQEVSDLQHALHAPQQFDITPPLLRFALDACAAQWVLGGPSANLNPSNIGILSNGQWALLDLSPAPQPVGLTRYGWWVNTMLAVGSQHPSQSSSSVLGYVGRLDGSGMLKYIEFLQSATSTIPAGAGTMTVPQIVRQMGSPHAPVLTPKEVSAFKSAIGSNRARGRSGGCSRMRSGGKAAGRVGKVAKRAWNAVADWLEQLMGLYVQNGDFPVPPLSPGDRPVTRALRQQRQLALEAMRDDVDRIGRSTKCAPGFRRHPTTKHCVPAGAVTGDYRHLDQLAYPDAPIDSEAFLRHVSMRLEAYGLSMPLPPAAGTGCGKPRPDKGYSLQPYQAVLGALIAPVSPIRKLLAVASTGAGKTCMMAAILRNWLIVPGALPPFRKGSYIRYHAEQEGKPHVYVVVPTETQATNFVQQLAEDCQGPIQLVARRALVWDTPNGKFKKGCALKPTVMKSLLRSMNIFVYSYVSFSNRVSGKTKDKEVNLKKSTSLVLMDEVHNLTQDHPSLKAASRALGKAGNACTMVGFTATPILDSPWDLHALATVFAANPPTKREYSSFFETNLETGVTSLTTNPEKRAKFAQMWRGCLTLYDNANDHHLFPRYDSPVVVEVAPSKQQIDKVAKSKKGTLGNDKLARLDARLSNTDIFYCKDVPAVVRTMKTRAPKIAKAVAHVKSCMEKKEKVLVYTDQNMTGAQLLLEGLLAGGVPPRGIGLLGYTPCQASTLKLYKSQVLLGEKAALDAFNRDELTVCIMSKKYAEGINFKKVEHMVFVDGVESSSRLEQVLGRARRLCSHAGLDTPRWKITLTVFATSSLVQHMATTILSARGKGAAKEYFFRRTRRTKSAIQPVTPAVTQADAEGGLLHLTDRKRFEAAHAQMVSFREVLQTMATQSLDCAVSKTRTGAPYCIKK